LKQIATASRFLFNAVQGQAANKIKPMKSQEVQQEQSSNFDFPKTVFWIMIAASFICLAYGSYASAENDNQQLFNSPIIYAGLSGFIPAAFLWVLIEIRDALNK
jgi:hypothetical protein